MAYTAAGLSPDGSSSYFLPRIIGMRRTQELMLTNRRLSAAEALDWGLVNRVVPADEVLAQADELAQQLAEGPTRAFGVVKKLLSTSFSETLETQMEYEATGIAGSSMTADGQEGITAFLEKRPPKFEGR
jgi:2-(1,2-epoxy-1,2-dihydrophenyl)acetyl-CoA isomerase